MNSSSIPNENKKRKHSSLENKTDISSGKKKEKNEIKRQNAYTRGFTIILTEQLNIPKDILNVMIEYLPFGSCLYTQCTKLPALYPFDMAEEGMRFTGFVVPNEIMSVHFDQTSNQDQDSFTVYVYEEDRIWKVEIKRNSFDFKSMWLHFSAIFSEKWLQNPIQMYQNSLYSLEYDPTNKLIMLRVCKNYLIDANGIPQTSNVNFLQLKLPEIYPLSESGSLTFHFVDLEQLAFSYGNQRLYFFQASAPFNYISSFTLCDFEPSLRGSIFPLIWECATKPDDPLLYIYIEVRKVNTISIFTKHTPHVMVRKFLIYSTYDSPQEDDFQSLTVSEDFLYVAFSYTINIYPVEAESPDDLLQTLRLNTHYTEEVKVICCGSRLYLPIHNSSRSSELWIWT